MNQVTLTSYNNEWSSLHTIVRTSVGQSNGKIIGAPFVIFLPYMSYRRDVFQQYSLSVPATWEQLLEVAVGFCQQLYAQHSMRLLKKTWPPCPLISEPIVLSHCESLLKVPVFQACMHWIGCWL